MKIALITLGCKTNQAESITLEQALSGVGHRTVDMSESPDLCIINTCAVTSKADYQSRQLINRALKNNSKVIVTGCYAELNREPLKRYGNDVVVIKNKDKSNIINMIPADSLTASSNKTAPMRHRPIVKVQDGCNYSCSYCTIPMARGKSKSITIEEVIDKIRAYESSGYKEVVLTGIHLGTYGLDLEPKQSLETLLNNILIYTKMPRVRLSSLEINEISEGLLKLIADNRVCKHLHIPLQSGDDNILKLMNRQYTSKKIYQGLENIIKKLPDIAIGTDVIVGFPGEGETEFKNTLRLINSSPFSYIHVFPYSKRPHTRAIAMDNHLPEQTKKERVSMLRSVGAIKKTEYTERNLSRTLDTVIENIDSEGAIGTTGNYIKVLIKETKGIREGMLVNTRISHYKNSIAYGIIENVL
jgi:threonylcarbamoyladenosine tRNA methylthiotransferase MtaB